jgi:pyruvate kinase
MKIPYNRTKIVATLGPACSTKDSLLAIIQAGVNICRINFSHGSHEVHLKSIHLIREINEQYKMNIGILADLQGPKIRIGMIKNNSITIVPGQRIAFTTHEVLGDEKELYLTYENFPKDVRPDELILLDDGKLQMKIIETNRKDRVLAEVVHGGVLSSKKGVNLPNTKISTSCLTEKDLEDLHFALDHNIEWIGLSFVRSAEDITQLKRIIHERGSSARTIAKIEKPEAIDCIDDIIDVTDGIMVARGDLGVEMPMEVVPLLQKSIVKKCILKSKPVIIATQMMESMITTARPTRAEVNDVANSVLDGADAVMLSAETSVGEYPVIVVETMTKIIQNIEEKEYPYNHLEFSPSPSAVLSDAICHSATFLARETNAKAIVSMTQSGYTAFEISSYRPEARTFIFTPNRSLLNTLNLVWGVKGFFYDKMESTDESINDVNTILKEEKMVEEGDVVINTSSMPILKKGKTNMIKVSIID